jgi:site-specific DNA-methyltransferase (adenine-specific)
MAVAVEDAGFTIKDQIMWMTTTKMPKYNRLKPAHEPIVVAQKPVEGTIKSNHEKWGCGLIDTDNTRIPWDKKPPTGWIKGGAKRRAFGKKVEKAKDYKIKELGGANPVGRYPSNIIGEVLPSHQKYFYAPRASRKEKGDYNDHPTVKPISLMSYLVRIYAPQNSTVLDPFCGSGTTAVSSILEKRNFVGIEMSKEYVEISNKRCESILIP